MAEHKNDEEQEPIRVNTREEFEDALDELFETGRPIEVPSVEALEAWGVRPRGRGRGHVTCRHCVVTRSPRSTPLPDLPFARTPNDPG